MTRYRESSSLYKCKGCGKYFVYCNCLNIRSLNKQTTSVNFDDTKPARMVLIDACYPGRDGIGADAVTELTARYQYDEEN